MQLVHDGVADRTVHLSAISARWSSRSSKHHIAESWAHLRVEECRTCRVYLKAVDLRLDGSAQSLVDELASVELGLWAHERGLDKLERNLLGL